MLHNVVTASTSSVQSNPSNSRVAIYRGSFDPPHYGHQQIVQYCLNVENCNKVYVMILNQAFYVKKPDRSDYLARMKMLDISFKFSPKIEVTSESQPELIQKLRKENPSVYIIKPMGDDKFFPTFDPQRAEELPSPDEWLVFPREINQSLSLPKEIQGIKIRIVSPQVFPPSSYSSTYVRNYFSTHDEAYDPATQIEEKLPVSTELSNYIRKSNLYRKPSTVDVLDELQQHEEEIKKAYNFTGKLYFKKLKGGICNSPIYVYNMINSIEKPLGVFKAEIESYEIANSRFDMLGEMTENGFDGNPDVYKNNAGEYLTRLGTRLYSLIEYIIPDLNHPENDLGMRDMLALTDKFHAYSQAVSDYPGLKMIRYELHMSRESVINEVDKLGLDPLLLKSEKWQRMQRIYQFFSSKEAKQIFDELPKQIINGDNSHENLIIRNGKTIFIDLDARRYDLRLYDITSFIRHGGSKRINDDYLDLVKNGRLVSVFEEYYGKTAKPLTALEKKEFSLVLIFSFVEFFSWILNRIKKEGAKANYVSYVEQKLDSLVAYLDLKILDESRFTQKPDLAVPSLSPNQNAHDRSIPKETSSHDRLQSLLRNRQFLIGAASGATVAVTALGLWSLFRNKTASKIANQEMANDVLTSGFPTYDHTKTIFK